MYRGANYQKQKAQSLVEAASTVTKRTPEKRIKALRRDLARQKPTLHTAASLYYLSLGTVPRSLWDND